MDRKVQNEKSSPDYKRIYNDIISRKHPEKRELCQSILSKQELSFLDIINLNQLLFKSESKTRSLFNQQHRSYDAHSIQQILEYQVSNKLSNSQLAAHFRLSRNTVSKWKKQKELG